MSENVTYIKNGSLAKIVLNRSKNNPLDLITLECLINCFQRSAKNEDSCVILIAEGRNFTVGADLKYLHSLFSKPDNTTEFYQFSECFQDLTRVMINHPGIIIIGLHGWVI
ncbi:MAG: enoyl-CoA hydratase/isomerase family protein, partial [Promethearchaeota archaeon]